MADIIGCDWSVFHTTDYSLAILKDLVTRARKSLLWIPNFAESSVRTYLGLSADFPVVVSSTLNERAVTLRELGGYFEYSVALQGRSMGVRLFGEQA